MNHCKTIAIVNQKGGVGKTTSTVNLGVGLAQAGNRVLLVDDDPQHSLTISLGIQYHVNGFYYNHYNIVDGTAKYVDGPWAAPQISGVEAPRCQRILPLSPARAGVFSE